MNIKLSLLVAFTTLGGSTNAETIRERLERHKEATEIAGTRESVKHLGVAAAYGFINVVLLGNRGVNQKDSDEFDASFNKNVQPYITRADLLESMCDCMATKESFISEKDSAQQCFEKLTDEVNLGKHSKSQIQKEIALEELIRIRNKDLRQSWFWWM